MGLKYHVATIVGILLSLGLGALFGINILSPEVARKVEQSSQSVVNLRQQFDEKIVTLQQENQKYHNLAEAALRNVRLTGVRVSIIQTGDYPDTASKVRETLDQAGATIGGTMIISPSFVTRFDFVKKDVLPLLQTAHPGLTDDVSAIWKTIATTFAKGAQDADLTLLRDNNLILQTEGDFSNPVEYVVLVGGASETQDSRADTVDVPLIKELKALSLKVVATEPEAAAVSYIPNLKNNEIATVDNADTDIGRVAVALAIRAAPGDYGVKKTARSGIIPSTHPQQ